MSSRANKKLRLELSRNGSNIHSGHYMTSCLNDRNDDTVSIRYCLLLISYNDAKW